MYCDDQVKNDEVKAALRQHGAKHSLFYAAENGMSELVADLIKEGADVKEQNQDGMTALMLACRSLLACEEEKEAAAAELMEATKNACALDVQGGGYKGSDKRSALHYASSSGLESAVAKLLSLGAEAALKDARGQTALDVAKNDEVKAVFFSHSLLVAAQFGKEEFVAAHIAREGADLAARDGGGRTALVVACAHGHEKAATQLVAHTHAAGALDVVGGDGFSALLWAEERGWDGMAQNLRECGARRTALALFRGECRST
jgi:ankyrin repeat protein